MDAILQRIRKTLLQVALTCSHQLAFPGASVHIRCTESLCRSK